MFNYFKKFIIGLKNSRFVNQDAPASKPRPVEGQEEAPEAGTAEGAAAEAGEQAADTAEAAKEIIDMKLTPKEAAAEQAKEDARRVASEKLKEAVDEKIEITRKGDVAAAEMVAEIDAKEATPDLDPGMIRKLEAESGAAEAKVELAKATEAVKEDAMVFTEADTEKSPEELAAIDAAKAAKETEAEELAKAVDERIEITKAADAEAKKISEEGV